MNQQAIKNPYALYIFCDGSMDYDSKNSGGIGYEIVFPDSVNSENITLSRGKFEGGNIERIELNALVLGFDKVIEVFNENKKKFSNINTIIFITDRFHLNDQELTNPFAIREWRKNKWHNHEGKSIKNSDLLDKLDKKRTKLCNIARSRVNIEYRPRRLNKVADNLAKKGKRRTLPDNSIEIKGIKVGKRKYHGEEIAYNKLNEKDSLHIRVFLKQPVRDQWEISSEICEGGNIEKKLRIYVDDKLAKKLQRGNEYKIRLKRICAHHVLIFRTIHKSKSE